MSASAVGALRADFTVDRPGFRLVAALDVPAGGRVAVLGPNGSGKSTLLSALAGLIPIASGEITMDARQLEVAGRSRLRPAQRRIGLLDQKPRLFPHLTVEQNIAFGPRSRGVHRRAAAEVADDWLNRLDLAGRGSAAPHELSGGQQQRVAIARAFAAEPLMILLDEPFAALDAESAPAVRRLLADELDRTGTSSVLVTHDLADAWQLADDCLVLHDGDIVERGAPASLASAPQHPFTARLAGFSVIEGQWCGDGLELGDGLRLPGHAEGALSDGDAAFAVIAPQDLSLDADAPFTMPVDAVSSRAGSVRIEHRSGLAVTVPVAQFYGLPLPRVGDRVALRIGSASVRPMPAPLNGREAAASS